MFILRLLNTLVFYVCLSCFFPLYSVPDLTIVGFVWPENGLGKVPINILETLGNNVSVNFIKTDLSPPIRQELLTRTIAAINNSDNRPGKVSLLTDMLADRNRQPFAYMPKDSIVKLAYSMFETTRIPDMWVKILNEEFDAVIVPDQYLVSIYENSGVSIPIFVLSIPMMLDSFYKHEIHSKSPSTPFVFGDASANKNPAILVKAFATAFGNSPDVHLVLRAGMIFNETRNIIDSLIAQYGLTNVTIEEKEFLLDQYIDRLASFDCYVNLSRGEGFSFIPREALALGIPVIITKNTASTTICESGFVRAVPCKLKGPSNFPYRILFNEDCGEQFDCEVSDAEAALRDVYDHYGEYIKKARKGREWVNQYNATNPNLRKLYRTLIKPKTIIFGDKNTIKNGVLITNSLKLFTKYQQIINSNL